MSHTNFAELLVRNDRGEIRIATWDEVIGVAREMMSAKVRHRKSMASSQLVKEFPRAMFFAGRVKAAPVKASLTQMPFWKIIGMRPTANGRSRLV